MMTGITQHQHQHQHHDDDYIVITTQWGQFPSSLLRRQQQQQKQQYQHTNKVVLVHSSATTATAATTTTNNHRRHHRHRHHRCTATLTLVPSSWGSRSTYIARWRRFFWTTIQSIIFWFLWMVGKSKNHHHHHPNNNNYNNRMHGWTFVEARLPELYERDRVEVYHRRNYTWPPLLSEFVPSTKGWIDLLQRRLVQADQLTDEEGSFDAYISTIHSMIAHNYTQHGWGLTKAPSNTLQAVYEYIDSTVGTKRTIHTTTATSSSLLNEEIISNLPYEEDEPAIETVAPPPPLSSSSSNNHHHDELLLRPKFLQLPSTILDRALQDVLPIVQAWVGKDVPLVPATAYGLRIYQNTSRLLMHTDFRDTHIISGILHIGHDTNQPWPLIIEGLDGSTNEVYLHPGELLLYESSKCWHGRMKRMDGQWYTNLFLHYHPLYGHTSGKVWADHAEDMEWTIHYRLPPHWFDQFNRTDVTTTTTTTTTAATTAYTNNNKNDNTVVGLDNDEKKNRNNITDNDVMWSAHFPEKLGMVSGAACEVGCPYNWCAMKDAIVIDSKTTTTTTPIDYGIVLTANGEIVDLMLSSSDQEQSSPRVGRDDDHDDTIGIDSTSEDL
jgi:hypothetical protein